MLALEKFGSAMTEIDMEYVNDWDGPCPSARSIPRIHRLVLWPNVLPRLTELHLAFGARGSQQSTD